MHRFILPALVLALLAPAASAVDPLDAVTIDCTGPARCDVDVPTYLTFASGCRTFLSPFGGYLACATGDGGFDVGLALCQGCNPPGVACSTSTLGTTECEPRGIWFPDFSVFDPVLP